MRALALAVLLAGCAHGQFQQRRQCWSECGARLIGSDDCDGFREAERKVIAELSRHAPAACSNMAGWIVQVVPTTANRWIDRSDRVVEGLAFCDHLVLQVGTDDWPTSSIAHEYIHAATECPWKNVDHEGWDRTWRESFERDVWSPGIRF